MKRETIKPESHEHWLELRSKDLTSTAISALFGLSPYMTEFELWHQMKNDVRVEFNETERVRWGARLEATIAEGVGEDQGWIVQPFKDYVRLSDLRIGSSFDYAIVDDSANGLKPTALLEIKNVDSLQYRNKWIIEAGEVIEAPPHIELQAQHQMLVSGIGQCYIAAFIGGNDVAIIKRVAEESIHKAIIDKAAKFWQSVERNIEPSPDFEKDAEFISALYGYAEPGSTVEADEEIISLAKKYKEISTQATAADKAKKAIKAEILMKMGEAEKVIGDVKISAGMVTVGEKVVKEYSYRGFRVTIPKEKK